MLIMLLQRWAQLEPDRCCKIGSHRPWYQVMIRGIPFDIDCEAPQTDRLGIRSLAYLQMAVEEAICDRLHFLFTVELCRRETGSPCWIGRVWRSGEAQPFEWTSNESAIAVGLAYVAALEGAISANVQASTTEGGAA